MVTQYYDGKKNLAKIERKAKKLENGKRLYTIYSGTNYVYESQLKDIAMSITIPFVTKL